MSTSCYSMMRAALGTEPCYNEVTLKLFGGNYNEPMTISKPMTIPAIRSEAVIGHD